MTPQSRETALALAQDPRHPPVHFNAAVLGAERLEQGFNLRDLLRIFLKRKWTILIIFSVFAVFSVVRTYMAQPVFRASTTLQIERFTPRVMDYKDVTPGETDYSDSVDFYTTNYELLKSRTLSERAVEDLGLRKPPPADAGKESMGRVAVEAVLQAPMGAIRVTTTHLEYYSNVQRQAQAQRLHALHEEACARAAAPGYPTAEGGPFDATALPTRAILTGDFNFPPENPAHGEIQRRLAGGGPPYRDTWQHLHGHRPHAPTFCVFDRRYSKAPYCCDFVFTSEDLLPRARSIEVDGATQASDHQPVLLELDDR